MHSGPEAVRDEHTRALTVLVAGLRPTGSDVLAQTLRLWADAGQASVVTLQQLRDSPDLRLDVPNVWVAENPMTISRPWTRRRGRIRRRAA